MSAVIADAGYAQFPTVAQRRDYIRTCLMQEMPARQIADLLGLKLTTVRRDLTEPEVRYHAIGYLYGRKGYTPAEIAAALMIREKPVLDLLARITADLDEAERKALDERRAHARAARSTAANTVQHLDQARSRRSAGPGDPCGGGPIGSVVSLDGYRASRGQR